MLRRLIQSGLFVVVALSPVAMRAATASGQVGVAAVHATRVADLVLFDRGLDAGLRQGMVCRVTRHGTDIAEVLVVESRVACSAALIVSLTPGQSVLPGDLASVKILKA